MPRNHVPHSAATSRRTPRALVDPIDNPADALALIAAAAQHPLEAETIAFALDDGGYGSVITVVSNTADPDCLLSIVEVLCSAASVDPFLTGLVVASVRPHGATEPGDIDRWLEASALAATFDIELIEWFVIGPAGAECPRD
ncbi:MAG: hypothetical protein WD023_06910, partial [Ilumatobacteraceae bacterium]